MAKTYNVFISHSWAHLDDLNNLKKLLEQRGYFKVEFLEKTPENPINSDNSAYIRSILKQQIINSDIVLALAGVYASHSEWMAWELDIAVANKINIVGVIPRGQERISTAVTSKSIADVKWNTESIVEAIRKYAK